MMAHPVAIATWDFGVHAVEVTGGAILEGTSLIAAVERGINAIELDPAVDSVGYGGFPNAAGEVELDAALMDGRDLSVGSVAALKGCRRPISVARAVLEHCHHSMLVGQGAHEFAVAHGFAVEETLHERARAAYERWRAAQDGGGHDTIGLCATDGSGHLTAACSTSGLRFKHPGRVGDSPIVGSGLYADDRAGAAAATGDGDHIQRYCLSFLVVELMRGGAAPMDACRQALLRYRASHSGPPTREVSLIALSPEGETGAATLRERFPYGVWMEDRAEARVVLAVDV